MTDITVTPYQEYQLTNADQLLLPAALKSVDANGLGIAKSRAASGFWNFEYTGGTFKLKDSAVLRSAGMAGSMYAYALPTAAAEMERIAAEQAAASLAVPARFRHGTALSNSLGGYFEDPARSINPFITDGGIGALRIPLRRANAWRDGVITESIVLNGYATKQWPALVKIIDACLANNVMAVIDDHTYSGYGEPDVLAFWVAMGTKLKEKYGDNDLIVLELQNESSKGGWDANYAQSVKGLVAGIRSAGINYPLAVGWGSWNSIGNFTQAMTQLDAAGGPQSVDPLNKIIWTAHHYPTTTGNDQPTTGKTAPEIKGTTVSAAFKTMFDGCRARGLQCMITEVGLGGGARSWLANGSNTPAFNGKAWFNEFHQLVAQYKGTVVGVLGWGGGMAWADTYPFKMEYAKDSWPQTLATDFWLTARNFWRMA
jgi:hypothetical protein